MRERILAPSILSADFNHLGEDIKAAMGAGGKYLHIDVMDGLFVPNISFGMPVIESIRKNTDAFFDLHLMITKPERYIRVFKDLGANMITVHVETLENPVETLNEIHALGAKAGIAIEPETPVERIFPYLGLVDMVLVMTVRPGIGGQKYIHECTGKIAAVQLELTKLQLQDKVDIEVDGGLCADNVEEALIAGANIIVAGTSVFTGDIEANVKAIMEHF